MINEIFDEKGEALSRLGDLEDDFNSHSQNSETDQKHLSDATYEFVKDQDQKVQTISNPIFKWVGVTDKELLINAGVVDESSGEDGALSFKRLSSGKAVLSVAKERDLNFNVDVLQDRWQVNTHGLSAGMFFQASGTSSDGYYIVTSTGVSAFTTLRTFKTAIDQDAGGEIYPDTSAQLFWDNISGKFVLKTRAGFLLGLDVQSLLTSQLTVNGIVSGASISTDSDFLDPSDTKLASQKSIRDFVYKVISELNWQDEVESRTTDIPGSPTAGVRYVIPIGATGEWATHENDIVQRNSENTAWTYIEPTRGVAVWCVDEGQWIMWNTTEWIQFGKVVRLSSLLVDDLDAGQLIRVNEAGTASETFLAPTRISTSAGVVDLARTISQNGQPIYGVDSGSSNSYQVNLTPAITTYEDGMVIHFRASFTNTSTGTLEVNGLGELDIKTAKNEYIEPGDILADQTVSVIYSSENSCFQIISGSGSNSSGDVAIKEEDIPGKLGRKLQPGNRISLVETTFPDSAYTTGTQGYLTSPNNELNTISQNIPIASETGDLGVWVGEYGWLSYTISLPSGVLEGENIPVSNYGSISFQNLGDYWGNFNTMDDGLYRFYLPRYVDGDIAGGYFEYYYSKTAWETAFNGNILDSVVIAQNGSVYKGSIIPSNLVVRWDGKLGPAGGGIKTDEDLLFLKVGYEDVNQNNIIYVGKHGNDANDGRTIDKAVLTIGQAQVKARALTPTATARAVIICFDDGIYAENINLGTASEDYYIDFDLPFATIQPTSGVPLTSYTVGDILFKVKNIIGNGTNYVLYIIDQPFRIEATSITGYRAYIAVFPGFPKQQYITCKEFILTNALNCEVALSLSAGKISLSKVVQSTFSGANNVHFSADEFIGSIETSYAVTHISANKLDALVDIDDAGGYCYVRAGEKTGLTLSGTHGVANTKISQANYIANRAITTPTSSEDGKSLIWNNTANQFEYQQQATPQNSIAYALIFG